MDRREAIKRTILLTGYAMSASTLTAVLHGCKAETAPDWQPAFLTPEQADLVADLGETILPHTDDSPGAKDVNVHRFIDLLLKDYTPAEDQKAFTDGLAALASQCAADNGGKAFADLSADERLAYLNQVNENAIKAIEEAAKQMNEANLKAMETQAPAPPSPPPFFINLKQAIIAAYFTSEEVGTKVLAYDPIPGELRACAPLEEVSGGKVWAL